MTVTANNIHAPRGLLYADFASRALLCVKLDPLFGIFVRAAHALTPNFYHFAIVGLVAFLSTVKAEALVAGVACYVNSSIVARARFQLDNHFAVFARAPLCSLRNVHVGFIEEGPVPVVLLQV